jgi:hypothetical protein
MIPSTDIAALHDAIKTALTAQFPGVTIGFYERPGESVPTPSILFETAEMLPDDPDEIGTEQLAVVINLNAYVALDYKSGKKKALRALVASLMAFIHGKRWGLPVGAASVTGAYPDRIRGRDNDYEVMRVEWTHEALLGIDVWEADQLKDEDGEPLPPPNEVYVSDDPGTPDSHEEIANCGCDAP